MGCRDSQQLSRKWHKSQGGNLKIGEKEEYHDGIVDNIFNNPSLLGKYNPEKFGKIIFKQKEPMLPGFSANKHNRSVIDLLFIGKSKDFLLFTIMEIKVGNHPKRREHGLFQLSKAFGYFKNNWKSFLESKNFKEISESIDVSLTRNVSFSRILIMRQFLETNLENWVKYHDKVSWYIG